jgi:hypothetical protein
MLSLNEKTFVEKLDFLLCFPSSVNFFHGLKNCLCIHNSS